MLDTKISRRTLMAGVGAAAATTLTSFRAGATPNWGTLDKVLSDAVAANDVPFLIAAVSDRNGILWQGAVGQAAPSLKASQDVVCTLYSQTKFIGSLAAMIMLDRGKLTLDTKVADVLPEFGKIQVLESIGPSGPVYRPPASPVLFRHLLTHTSGLAYSPWDAKENDWETYTKTPPPNVGTMQGWTHPLMFDPGTGWTYGVGMDWVGFVVEKVDGRPIDQFCYEEIFEPLHMDSTMFETDAVKDRLAAPLIRGADGKFTNADFMLTPSRPEKYGMGQALHGTALDYLKALRLVLNDGTVDGRQILSSKMMALMKQNQIGSMRLPFPLKTTQPTIGADLDLFPRQNIPLTHTFGFMRNEVDVPGRRRAGSLTWAGILNTHHWVDPTSGIAATLFTQTLPFIEPRWMDLYAKFEKVVYSEISA
jgi:methyl acetate hydrolase